jgi:hypothetical protein
MVNTCDGEAVPSTISRVVGDVVSKTGVLLLPASVYGHQTSTSNGHFRLGLGRTNLPACLQRLESYLAGM